jgi:hypothetical protein
MKGQINLPLHLLYFTKSDVNIFILLKACTIILSIGKIIYQWYFSELLLEASKLKMLFEEVKLIKK